MTRCSRVSPAGGRLPLTEREPHAHAGAGSDDQEYPNQPPLGATPIKPPRGIPPRQWLNHLAEQVIRRSIIEVEHESQRWDGGSAHADDGCGPTALCRNRRL